MTGVIDRLERKGWVHRSKDTRDRRRVVVVLRPDARRSRMVTRLMQPLHDRVVKLVGSHDAGQTQRMRGRVAGSRYAGSMMRRQWVAVAWALGVLAGYGARWLIVHSQALTTPVLSPLSLGGLTVLLPEGARVESSGADLAPLASWASAASRTTRCGSREQVRLLPLVPDQPRAVLCGTEDLFAGGSSAGDCPRTSVCTAVRGKYQLLCESDRGDCPSIAAAFADAP